YGDRSGWGDSIFTRALGRMSRTKLSRTKRLLPRFAVLLALASAGANAADLGVQPVYKAPPPPAAITYDWRGFYVGGHVGGVSSTIDSTTIDIATNLPTGPAALSSSASIFGGGQIGYN